MATTGVKLIVGLIVTNSSWKDSFGSQANCFNYDNVFIVCHELRVIQSSICYIGSIKLLNLSDIITNLSIRNV